MTALSIPRARGFGLAALPVVGEVACSPECQEEVGQAAERQQGCNRRNRLGHFDSLPDWEEMSCRTGPLRVGRSLRDACIPSVGPPVGRDHLSSDQREDHCR